ncbi:hypothetical protein EMIT07CA2_180046 [Brevibacillus sp. IT-7CA2]
MHVAKCTKALLKNIEITLHTYCMYVKLTSSNREGEIRNESEQFLSCHFDRTS